MKKRISTKEILLWILNAGGIITFSIISPQLPYKLLHGYLKERRRLKERLKNLQERGWIKITEENNQFKLELIEQGKKRALYYNLEELEIKKPKKWDGFWRVVVFDIPEEKKIAREILRTKLKKLGFYQLQKSVFIFPYDCQKEIEIIKNAYEIWPYITLMVIKKIDCENKIKEIFKI